MTNKISQLAKTIAKVIGLASATLPVSQSFAQPTSSENSGNTIEYSTAKTTRSTIPVLKLSLNNMNNGKFVSSHGSHRSHSSHSSHSSHRSSSFVY
jgi:hypothetical protein